MEWPFEFSFMMFLLIAFLSYGIEIKSKFRLSLPFALGSICILGFGTGIFPTEFIVQSKMKEIGIIAFNMLIINSGTMIDFKALKTQKTNIFISVISVFIMSIVIIWGIGPFLGREFAAMAPGPLIGGGAAAAISSISMMQINPGISVFPWLIFMIQCLIGIPLYSYSIKRESMLILENYRNMDKDKDKREKISPNIEIREEKLKLCHRIPSKYKTTAYYLGSLMIVSVFNRWIVTAFLMKFGININITALIFGILLGNIGILERGPLVKSNTMGFLMLGLMALMADTLAHTSLEVLSSLLIPLVIISTVGGIVLLIIGVVISKIYKFSTFRGIIITLNSMVGFPVNLHLVDEAANKLGKNGKEIQVIKENLNPMLSAGSMVVINIISILLSSTVLLFV